MYLAILRLSTTTRRVGEGSGTASAESDGGIVVFRECVGGHDILGYSLGWHIRALYVYVTRSKGFREVSNIENSTEQ